ncbi:MAG: hypothetical protein HY695_32380 [Deltaproteobacteria bacterium]|nr:hypothetical protein [Deltaproteobacteria bacterium]
MTVPTLAYYFAAGLFYCKTLIVDLNVRINEFSQYASLSFMQLFIVRVAAFPPIYCTSQRTPLAQKLPVKWEKTKLTVPEGRGGAMDTAMRGSVCRKAQSSGQRTRRTGTTEPVDIKEPHRADGAQPRTVEEKLPESEDRPPRLVGELEQELISSNRLVSFGEMLASLAHELSNSLQIIAGFTQDVLSSAKLCAPHYRHLEIVEKEALRCCETIRNFHDFAYPAELDLVLSAIEPIIRESLTVAQGYLDHCKIKAEVELQPVLPQIRANSQQMQEVLVNLFFNAADAMPAGGKLTIRAVTTPLNSDQANQKGSSEVTIAISDTGTGMDSETLSKIFQPFFSTKKNRGMGLGLAICNRIVKAHGGKMTVESRPGVGTTFFLHFPAA